MIGQPNMCLSCFVEIVSYKIFVINKLQLLQFWCFAIWLMVVVYYYLVISMLFSELV